MLPDRIGCNKALDAALLCVLSYHEDFCKDRITSERKQENLELYQSTIDALLHDVSQTENSRPLPESIAAALLLATCEIYSREHRGQVWTSHVEGISAMMARWDPGNLDEFEHCLLVAYAPVHIAKCLGAQKSCFLSSEPWATALQTSSVGNDMRLGLKVDCILAKFTSMLNDIAEGALKAQRDPRASRNAISGLVDLGSQLLSMKGQILTIRRRLPKRWTANILPFRTPELSASWFSSPQSARGFAMYWAAWLIVYSSAARIGLSPLTDALKPGVALDFICGLFEYAHSMRPLGCIYMSWCIPIAYVSAATEAKRRRWLLDSANLLFGSLDFEYTHLHLQAEGEMLTGGIVSLVLPLPC